MTRRRFFAVITAGLAWIGVTPRESYTLEFPWTEYGMLWDGEKWVPYTWRVNGPTPEQIRHARVDVRS